MRATKRIPSDQQPVAHIEWDAEDALPFPLCLSSKTDPEHGEDEIADVSVALGNIVLADHGRTIEQEEDLGIVPPPRIFRVPSSSGFAAGGELQGGQRRLNRRLAADLSSLPSGFEGAAADSCGAASLWLKVQILFSRLVRHCNILERPCARKLSP